MLYKNFNRFDDICWYFTLYLIFIGWLRFFNHLLNYYLLTYLLIKIISTFHSSFRHQHQMTSFFRTQKVLYVSASTSHCFRKQSDVVVFYISATCFQFQFPLFVFFYSMPDRTWTTTFRFFDLKLSSKSDFSTYSYCERIMNQSSSRITCMRIQNILYHLWVDRKGAEFIANNK